MSRPRFPARTLFSALCCASLAGCAYQDYERDVDHNPVVNTGAGASIIYPGQTAPPAPGSVMPGAQPPAGPEGQQAQAGGTPGVPNVTFIGGASVDDKRSQRIHEEPSYYKYLGLPFAVLAAPFVAIAEAVRGEPESGPEIPKKQALPQGAPPAPAPPDYETQQLEAMEHELDQRRATPAGARPGILPPPQGAPATWKPQSIADELAALQRTPDFEAPRSMRRSAPPAPGTPSPPGPSARPGEHPLAAADGIVDRNGDGQIDQWIFRENGEIVRTVFDDDDDGYAERTVHYDRQSHRISRVDEDRDRDGTTDSWTDFREGELFRRRLDADSDGSVDSWSYYRAEELTRHELDTTGDGFRDRTAYYDSGEIVREEQDRDGDGQTDLTVHFDGDARISKREEDTDGDGRLDTISHYEGGRLTRRELLEE